MTDEREQEQPEEKEGEEIDRTVVEHAPLDLPVQLQRHFDEIFRG